MSEELCKQIDQIEEYITFDSESQNYTLSDGILKAYCTNQKCDSDDLKLGSAFMALLENFNSNDGEDPESDKLYQYAILWLSYKIKQNPKIEFIRTTIDDILKKNEWYNELNIPADDKKNMIRFHYIYFTNLYNFLKGICETINKCKSSSSNDECIESAKKCGELYRSCLIAFPWKEICNPYCNVLTNLKNDYDKIRKKYSNLPELELKEGLLECNEECSKKAATRPNSLPGLPVIPTSINNGNKLPYIAVPLVLIPIILGISYKYLTHGRRKKLNAKKKVKAIINLCDEKKA
ncbi:CIR protein [Plasmodium chabaudi chabaudi]|uniref:CIR protein n=1 Tax=Plasmodium chabaudi chabaudi TaxID=31271 RepID=A0A4V0K3W2_PLACU|nr:CIR protein [Plasmodium chabaudi chabaudi]VTZ67598.1 CIR protein [Plasmodium chabaudi chabaudi]|eukprot:XP_016653363.1 CIR protein [Plasmodium chabaudi chabaudi]